MVEYLYHLIIQNSQNVTITTRLWTKRAVTTDEEKFAIVELDVTVGNMKKATDEIWNSPGVGWIRVDGNFTKSYFGSIDAFL